MSSDSDRHAITGILNAASDSFDEKEYVGLTREEAINSDADWNATDETCRLLLEASSVPRSLVCTTALLSGLY